MRVELSLSEGKVWSRVRGQSGKNKAAKLLAVSLLPFGPKSAKDEPLCVRDIVGLRRTGTVITHERLKNRRRLAYLRQAVDGIAQQPKAIEHISKNRRFSDRTLPALRPIRPQPKPMPGKDMPRFSNGSCRPVIRDTGHET